jgi:signal peptidase I
MAQQRTSTKRIVRLVSVSLAALFALVFGFLAFRTWGVQGTVFPVRVASGSMAPTLLGPHLRLTCPDCGFPFAFGSEFIADEFTTVCPNCGCRDQDIDLATAHAGQRVWIDKYAYLVSHPNRWDLIALHPPDDDSRLVVKRVVGLPGETVAIRDGDICIDGNLVRKPLNVMREMAVLVHNERFRTTDDELPPRWHGGT